jgi:hypothetical protein
VFVTASEPLSSTLELRVQGAGVSSVLGSYELFAARATFYTVTNPKPLPWATSLSVDVGPALTDLAGNRGLSPPTFATYADPGVQPLDGFEGAPDNALLLGNARFVGPADSPGAIAGQRSLLVGPELRGQRPPGRATFREVVPAGMQPRKLRATVRTVADAQGFTGWAGVIMVFAGGAFREGGITFPQAAHTTSSAPFVSDPLDYSADLGATGAPAGTDVIVDVRSTYVYCGGPLPPPNALLVDDVRFE